MSVNRDPLRSRTLLIFYVVLAVFVGATLTVAFTIGSGLDAEPEVAGRYALDSPDTCLGTTIDLRQSGQFGAVSGPNSELGGNVTIEDGRLDGELRCEVGEPQQLTAHAADGQIEGKIGVRALNAERVAEEPSLEERSAVVPRSIDGPYELDPTSPCLGGSLTISNQGGSLSLRGSEGANGVGMYRGDHLQGSVNCADGTTAEIAGTAHAQDLELELNGEGEAAVERLVATEKREFGETLAVFLGAVIVVMVAARAFGWVATRIGQPRVMGEVVAGIVLGPTLFGALLPQLQSAIFPPDLVPVLGIVANLGLVFYMFMIGIELDPAQLRGRIVQALTISNASVAIPMSLGVLAAIPVYALTGREVGFVPFALFMGVAMSITAFPVLARILVERRMLSQPVGATTLAAAAIDDVTAWILIALAIAVAGSGDSLALTIGLAIAFCLVMALAIRPLMARVSTVYDELGRIPVGWLATIFAGVLLSAYTTEQIGIALIFGAFVMGLIMPRHAELTEDVTKRMEDFVVLILLPLFFAYTGLRTNIGLLDRPELWLLAAGLLVVAIVGKLTGATVAARISGFDWRSSAAIGALMNTRGLTELIVLNLALELGVLSEALFAALVIMALATTFMAGPLLRLIDPHNTLGAPVEDAVDDASRAAADPHRELAIPDRSILLAPQSSQGARQLAELGATLAGSVPPRELILVRLVAPTRGAAAGVRAGLQTEARLLEETSKEAEAVRDELIAQGIATRSAALISTSPGEDLLRIGNAPSVDLILLAGRRSLLGDAAPGGQATTVLHRAPSDVAVLIAREDTELELNAATRILVPFGNAEHDWAALELGAWIVAACGGSLSIFGATRSDQETSRVSRLLGDASLLVQQHAQIPVEPVLGEPGSRALSAHAAGATLLVVGLPSDWRSTGLGRTRTAIVTDADTPVLFVRRGTRPGTLAPADDLTSFGWSSTHIGQAP